MKVTIEDIDKAILSGLLAYKEVASTVIDELKEENAKLKKELEEAKRMRYTPESLSLSDVVERLPGKHLLNTQEEKK